MSTHLATGPEGSPLTSAQEGTSRYSLDAVIERRVSWWHWVAEVGRHHEPTSVAIPEKRKTLDRPRSAA